MPVTTDTELFALRTLNKEQLIKKILELQDDMAELYDEDGIENSSTYQELYDEYDELKEKHQELRYENEELKEKCDALENHNKELAVTVKVLEDFLDRRMGTEEELGYIPDSRPTIQFMDRYSAEWEDIIFKQYGEIDEEDKNYQGNQ